MLKKNLLHACLLVCMPILACAEPITALNTFVEAALANDPSRLKAIELLHAAEADAAAERARRMLDGTISAAAGKNKGIGAADADGVTFEGGVSASSLMPAGAKLSVGSTYGYSSVDTVPSTTGKTDTAKFSASVAIPIFVNGRLVDPRLESAAKATAIDLPLEAARESADTQERTTIDAVLRLALDAAEANRASELAARHAVIAERDAEIARVKREQGTLSFADLSKTEKDADEARLAALESQFTRDKKRRALSAATGIAETNIDLSAIVAPESSLDPALAQGPVVTQGMRQTARERKIAEMNLVLAGADSVPSLAFSSETSLPGPVSRNQKTYDPDLKGTWSATATVTVPLPTGFSSAHRNAAAARLAAAQQAETAVIRAASDDLNDLRNAWTTARARVLLREQLLEQAQARLRDVRSSNETQTATKLDVDRAELTVADALAALETDRAASFKAALDIYARCGLTPLSLLKEIQS